MFIYWEAENSIGLLGDDKNSCMNKIFFIIGFFFQAHAWSDQIKTLDGSILQGDILGMVDGNVSIETVYAGTLKIPEDQISAISSTRELSVRTEDNRTFRGKIDFSENGNFSLENQNEIFSFPMVRHLWQEDADDPLILTAQQKAEALLLNWIHALGLDLTGSSGNVDNFGLGVRLDSSFSNQFRGYDIYLSYNKAENDSTVVEDETKIGAEYDSRFYDTLSWYAKADLENDKLEEIDLRATTALGLKYNWIEEQDYKIALRSGLAFRYEKSGSSDTKNQNDPAIDLGLEYSHDIKDYLALESDLTFIPSLSNLEKFLFSSDTAVVFPLTKEINWNLRSGLVGTYNSTPVESKEEMDIKYYIRLVYLFK